MSLFRWIAETLALTHRVNFMGVTIHDHGWRRFDSPMQRAATKKNHVWAGENFTPRFTHCSVLGCRAVVPTNETFDRIKPEDLEAIRVHLAYFGRALFVPKAILELPERDSISYR
jgi:hypothetical protein